ncbi:carbohydrate kinase [Afifella sp. JA880]|uniref:carbohydrate kinase family protein n=1 Tax=Afifella sp. JA880 TaxID=2975280 RepID=UPI0021BA5485|nr:carbohydrate kinase [Afifella sp. JA880]MCT8267759.1 carbohydrate kinase [Afifella sp. JA880]
MFVVCGEALWDLYGSDQGEGLSFDARIGGSPFNVAVGLARLDQEAALFTGLSTDLLGEKLFAALKTEGVETGFLLRSSRRTTLSLVTLGKDGSPSYAFYGDGAADRAVNLSDLPVFSRDIWGVHAGSFSLVTEPIGTSLLSLLGREAGERLVTLDPNVRINVEPDLSLWRERLDAFVPTADLIKVSEEDLGLLYPSAPPAETAERWRAAGATLVVVTYGREGAEAFGSFGRVSVKGSKVDVVDTVGAGDSFMAALIAGLSERSTKSREALSLLRRDEVEALLAFATEAAGITCGRRGADPPRRAELGAAASLDG